MSPWISAKELVFVLFMLWAGGVWARPESKWKVERLLLVARVSLFVWLKCFCDWTVKPISPQDAAVWVNWVTSWVECCYVVSLDVVCICPLAVQFLWYFCKFHLKSVSQSDKMGTQSGWRFSWLWESLDVIARCPVHLDTLI